MSPIGSTVYVQIYQYCLSIWNSLDANIVNSDTVFEFKRKLNSFDVTNYCRGRAYRAILRVLELFI